MRNGSGWTTERCTAHPHASRSATELEQSCQLPVFDAPGCEASTRVSAARGVLGPSPSMGTLDSQGIGTAIGPHDPDGQTGGDVDGEILVGLLEPMPESSGFRGLVSPDDLEHGRHGEFAGVDHRDACLGPLGSEDAAARVQSPLTSVRMEGAGGRGRRLLAGRLQRGGRPSNEKGAVLRPERQSQVAGPPSGLDLDGPFVGFIGDVVHLE